MKHISKHILITYKYKYTFITLYVHTNTYILRGILYIQYTQIFYTFYKQILVYSYILIQKTAWRYYAADV